MKKLLTVLVIVFMGCGYSPMDNIDPIVVTDIKHHSGYLCTYYGKGNHWLVISTTDRNFMFRDTCGKFQIGDTINFVKK